MLPSKWPAKRAIHDHLTGLDGVVAKEAWGERSYFYNPGRVFEHGTYVATIKERDGENDRASNLDRGGVFRLNMCLPRSDYVGLFGPVPDRPAKGEVVAGDWAFQAVDRLLPHPVYAWMGWVCILSPSPERLEEITPLIELSYGLAVGKFDRRQRQRDRRTLLTADGRMPRPGDGC